MNCRQYLKMLGSLLMLVTSAKVTAQTTGQDSSVFKWDDGIKFEYFDKSNLNKSKAEIKLGGRIHYDMAFFNQDAALSSEVGELKNALELRRVRFYNSGNLFYGDLQYKLQVEFSGSSIAMRDAYIEYKLMNLSNNLTGNLRVGQFKEPIRWEVQESSNNMSFIERSYTVNFMPERNSGIMYHIEDAASKFSFQTGVFGNADDSGNDLANNDGINISSRVTYAPIVKKNQTLFFGVGHSFRDAGDAGKFSYSARPPAHTAPKYLSAKIDGIDDIQIVNLEAFYIRNSLMLQSEYLVTRVNAQTSSYTLSAFYGQVSYFLGSKPNSINGHVYKGALSGLTHTTMKNAWELALRYSYANLNDADFLGGKINDVTLGLNYFINSKAKIMANYSFVNVDSVGKANNLDLRFMLYF